MVGERSGAHDDRTAGRDRPWSDRWCNVVEIAEFVQIVGRADVEPGSAGRALDATEAAVPSAVAPIRTSVALWVVPFGLGRLHAGRTIPGTVASLASDLVVRPHEMERSAATIAPIV